jgi:excisionase family DNA binding protein
MRTASNKLQINELPDVLGPIDIARFLGIHQQAAYDIVHRKGFPVLKIGRKYLIRKESFFKWLDTQEHK